MDQIISNFIECIVNNKKPLITANDGLRSLEIVLRAYNAILDYRLYGLKRQVNLKRINSIATI